MKDYKDIKVLLIEGRARQVLPMSKSLRELGCEVTTYNSSKLDPGYASKYPHRKLLGYCDAHNPQGSYEAIKAELEKYKYDIVIPLNDDVAIILSQHKEDLRNLTTIAVEDWDTFQMASDKLKTMLVCMEHKLPCPLSFIDKQDYLANKKKVQFPVVVKPRTGCAAVGFHVAENEQDLIDSMTRQNTSMEGCSFKNIYHKTAFNINVKCLLIAMVN